MVRNYGLQIFRSTCIVAFIVSDHVTDLEGQGQDQGHIVQADKEKGRNLRKESKYHYSKLSV